MIWNSVLFGLYKHIGRHFVLRKFTSIAKHSVSEETYEVFSNLEEMPSVSLPVFILSNLKGTAKHWMTKFYVRNDVNFGFRNHKDINVS